MLRKKTKPLPGRLSFNAFFFAAIVLGLVATASALLYGREMAPKGLAGTGGETGRSAAAEKPYLGIIYVPITVPMARYYELATDSGALVTAVAERSPAEKAGIQSADIITEFDGQRLDDEVSLLDLLSRRASGDKVEVRIIRKGEQLSLAVVLASRPGS